MSNIIYNIKESKQQKIFVDEGDIMNIIDEKLKDNYEKIKDNCENNEFDKIYSMQLDYDENYIKKDIDLIADYYKISKRKKRKMELIQDIVLFEINPGNESIVQKRKLMWFYISEIEEDSYLRKFLIFN
mgnify:FL=1|tara:strand:+ start:5364 stop:5750 length:387 start_codon:yes stop_codon:yes gene_type:complete